MVLRVGRQRRLQVAGLVPHIYRLRMASAHWVAAVVEGKAETQTSKVGPAEGAHITASQGEQRSPALGMRVAGQLVERTTGRVVVVVRRSRGRREP